MANRHIPTEINYCQGMRKTLKKAKTPPGAPAAVAIPVGSAPGSESVREAALEAAQEAAPNQESVRVEGRADADAHIDADQVVVPRPMTAQEAESAAAKGGRTAKTAKASKTEKAAKADKTVKAAKVTKPRIRAKRQSSPPEPVEALADVRAELADLTTRIDRERQVRCLPGQDFPLDTAAGRQIKADIERLRSADPASVTVADAVVYFVELRDVCRRLLAEVCFGDSPGRRQATARATSKVGRQMMPREHFTCLDGPAAVSPDEAASH